ARDTANAELARVVGEARDLAAAHAVGVRRVLRVGAQPRLLVEYQRRVYLSFIETGYALGTTWLVAHDHLSPVFGAVLALAIFWPHWRPRRAGSYERPRLGERLRSWWSRVRNTPWERGGALAYTITLWKLALPVPLAGVTALAASHPTTAWLAMLLSVVSLEVSTSSEVYVGRVPDPMVNGLRRVEPQDRSTWSPEALPWGRVSVSVVVLGLVKVSVFVQVFTLLATGFGQVPGVVPPRIVGFRPWSRFLARWESYDKGLWSKTANHFVFPQAGFGFGFAGGVMLEPRRSLRKLIVRAFGRQRFIVDTFGGPARVTGRVVFAVLRGIGWVLTAGMRDRLARSAARRAIRADLQQA
ncbi:MAG: hypothetical protein ACRDXB_18685, partial [Actinomycetes bacterium]